MPKIVLVHYLLGSSSGRKYLWWLVRAC